MFDPNLGRGAMCSSRQRQLLILCALRVDGVGLDWQLLARVSQRDQGLELLHRGEIPETSRAATAASPLLRRALHGAGLPDARAAAEKRVDHELAAAARIGANLTTVLDDDYPANLRLIPNLPPFLFVLGRLHAADARSVAVVGTRQATPAGEARARSLACELATNGVTITSGLARGIDTAAHRAALEQHGRTVAVIGTGITRCYPAENAALAEEIAHQGAVVSQFWPTSPPSKLTFPRRNVVMSGISQGTVVIEASGTSGAKMQARIASEHGKQVYLVRSLVTEQEWAQRMIARGEAIEIEHVEDVVSRLATPERVRAVSDHRQQLALEIL